jgi:hypothetical protein
MAEIFGSMSNQSHPARVQLVSLVVSLVVSRIDFVSIPSGADPDQTTNQPICVDILHPPTRSQKTKKEVVDAM